MRRKRWSEQVGPHGARVQVRERTVGGPVYIYAWDPEIGGKRGRSLGFRVRDTDGDLIEEAVEAAKVEAAKLSNRLIEGENPHRAVTCRELFLLYERHEVSAMDGKYRDETARSLGAWTAYLGPRFAVSRIGPREWNGFARARAGGEIDAKGRPVPPSVESCPACTADTRKKCTRCDGRGRIGPRRTVGPRTVAKDLKVLRAACLYGTRHRTRDGGFLLSVEPTRGLALPSEKNPSRPVADDRTLESLLAVAPDVTMRSGEQDVRSPLRELLILAAHTGRRIGSILALRWSDWRPSEGAHGAIRWRADSDKLGREWRTPVHPEVAAALEAWRAEGSPGLGETWIFPAPESDGHVRSDVARRWLLDAEERAEIPHVSGFGFHAFRRMWATKRKHLSAKDVAAVGGWKDTATLQRVYQAPDPDTMESVVLGGRSLRIGTDDR